MFRKTSPQMSMLESQYLLPEPKRQRLEASWAHSFRTIVLPLIDEELFRESFHDSNGRPNKSIRLMVGLHILKEMNDLTDAEVIDALEFNLQFHYALGVEPRTAHVCQKTLHNHRLLLLESDRARQVMEGVTRGLAEADGLSLGVQRLDSTHVMSNIAVLTRLGLFVETVTTFLRSLRRELPAKMELIDPGYIHRYLDREGYFADAKRKQARRRIRAVASDMYRLVVAFEADREVSGFDAFGLLKRLFEEQCEVVASDTPDEAPVAVPRVSDELADEPLSEEEEDDAPVEQALGGSTDGEGLAPIRLREGKEISSGSLQSPHDPEATYGHKGKGYEVQVAETCESDNGYQVITAIKVNGANESDQAATVPVVEQLAAAELTPTRLFADTGYGSGSNIVACASRGVDLQAPVPDPRAPEQRDRMEAPVEPQMLIEPPEESAADSDATAAKESEEPARPTEPEPIAPESKLSLADFSFGEGFERVLGCPAGHAPVKQHLNGGRTRMWVTFSAASCEGCPLATRCPTRRRKDGRRTLQTSVNAAATRTRQREQQTSRFKDRYKIRSGIESTNAELKSRHGAGGLRVRGKARVEMTMQMKATALNIKRATAWHAAQGSPGRDGPGDVDVPMPLARDQVPESPPQPPPGVLMPPLPRPREKAEGRPWWRGLTRRLIRRFVPAASPGRHAPTMGWMPA